MVLGDPPNAQVSCTPDGNGGVTYGDLTDLDGNPVAGGALGLLLRDVAAGANGNCTISADVTADLEATLENTIAPNAVQNPGGIGSTAASATRQSYGEIQVAKTVVCQQGGTGRVAPGQWAEFSVTIRNYSGAQVTNANITDRYSRERYLQNSASKRVSAEFSWKQ